MDTVLEENENETSPEYLLLKDDAIYFRNEWEEKKSSREFIPPNTPNSNCDFSNFVNSFPNSFPDVENLDLPKIREKGVKFCIDLLGSYLGCDDYKFNLLQFWFLDILTDCLWKAQDDFQLPDDMQKVILRWVIYFINLLKDVGNNYTRKEFFHMFKEAILVAAEVVDEGFEIPAPENLFELVEQEEVPQSWRSSTITNSAIELSSRELKNTSYIQVGNGNDNPAIYLIPSESCSCDQYDLSTKGSEDTEVREQSTRQELSDKSKDELIQEEADFVDFAQFYQPDLGVPPRFLESVLEEGEMEYAEEQSRIELNTCKLEDQPVLAEEENVTELLQSSQQNLSDQNIDGGYDVYEIPVNCHIRPGNILSATDTAHDTQGSDQSLNRQGSSERQEKSVPGESTPSNEYVASLIRNRKERKIMKDLAFQKMWEQRLKDMDDPRKGWLPGKHEIEPEEQGESAEAPITEESGSSDDEEWIDMVLEKEQEDICLHSDKQTMYFGALWLIIDFMFKHFYESFQFTLIKLAFQATPDIITQTLNTEWMTPKRIKSELQKPKPEKVKKVKEKPAKKEKSKDSKKSDSKKGSTKKSDKKETPKKKDDKKKAKKEKPVKLTKEEKAELERQKKEQERLEEEKRKLEENKRFVFPLTDAATDEFYMGIFENWVKVDLTKGKKKGKDDKKGKGKKK